MEIHLGDSLRLEPQLNFTPDSLQWLPPVAGLSCTACLSPWAKPGETAEYRLRAWSAEGCLVEAAVRVRVDRKLRAYVPTAFSPDGDGRNDFFEVFTGPEVALVKRLEVFDRWGTQVFEAQNFQANTAAGQWDGRLRGSALNPGVFTWLCVLELADGAEQVLSGDVTLVR